MGLKNLTPKQYKSYLAFVKSDPFLPSGVTHLEAWKKKEKKKGLNKFL